MGGRTLLVAAAVAALSLFPGAFYASADTVGNISSIQGQVSLSRGNQIHSNDLSIGFSLQNFDQITTGGDGIVQVQLDPASGLDGTLTVQPGTTVSIEISAANEGRQAALELMSGMITVKITDSAASLPFAVRTNAAVMKVRGAEFDVATTIAGDMLVSVKAGTVVCEDETGAVLYAEPERAVEQLFGGGFRTRVIQTGKADAFRIEWMKQRLLTFQKAASQTANISVIRYRREKPQFDSAYAALMGQREIIDRWLSEDRSGAPAPQPVAAGEMSRISPDLDALRRIAFYFSRSFYRVKALEQYYQSATRWKNTQDVKFNRFFAEFDNEKGKIADRLQTVRYITRMYAERGGELPLSALPPVPQGTDAAILP